MTNTSTTEGPLELGDIFDSPVEPTNRERRAQVRNDRRRYAAAQKRAKADQPYSPKQMTRWHVFANIFFSGMWWKTVLGLFFGGVLGVLLAFIVIDAAKPIAVFGLMIVGAIIGLVYGHWIAAKEKDREVERRAQEGTIETDSSDSAPTIPIHTA